MASTSSGVDLNFLELLEQDFAFEVYRAPADAWEPTDEERFQVRQYKLWSRDNREEEKEKYWIRLDPHENFERFECNSKDNRDLTCQYMYLITVARAREAGFPQYGEEERKVRLRRIFAPVGQFSEGDQVVWIRPLFLRRTESFGYLVDFQFKSKINRHTRRTQELSLSLKNGRENRDFYVDRRSMLERFFHTHFDRLFPPDGPVQVSKTLLPRPLNGLSPKVFELNRQQSDTAPFAGIKKFGPYQNIPGRLGLHFVFREQDRELSRDLFRGLRGDTFGTFPGFEKIFGTRLSNANVSGQAISGFSRPELLPAISNVQDSPHDVTIPILLTPFNKDGGPDDSKQYYLAKHEFLQRGIPCQFVSLPIVREQNRLKWSISNIALQIFAKAGGIPWRLRPVSDPSLILGLGQAHSKDKDGTIQKYFAYSVQTDSSGLYKDLRVLGTSSGEQDYLQQLRQNISGVIRQYAGDYSRFVIHSPFYLRYSEMKAIEETLKSLNECGEIIFMNFNTASDFFGYSQRSGSLVPTEGSWTQVAYREFLIWFEGLRHRDATAYKRFGGPAHVQFRYPRDGLSLEDCISCLQDAFLLSGANWRGFKGKAIPVSIHYARIIAKYYQNFQALGLSDIDLRAIRPWFL